MAFGLETASVKEPALFVLGVAGGPFFTSFALGEGPSWSSSSGRVGGAEAAAALPSSLFHLGGKGEVWTAPFGPAAGGLLPPSRAGVAGCAEPLDTGPPPPPEQRPPNLGNLDTMADLRDAFLSMGRREWHGETGKPTRVGGWETAKVNEEAL